MRMTKQCLASSGTLTEQLILKLQYPNTVLCAGRRYGLNLPRQRGYVSGSLFSGLISDKIGRKPTIIISAWLYLIFSTLAAFSPSIAIFSAFRFCTASCVLSLYNASFTYCMEIVGGNWVTVVSVIYGLCPSFGFMCVPLLSWIFPTWTHLQLAITWPMLMIIIPICVPICFHESPKWLLAKGFHVEAEAVVKIAAETNSLEYEECSDSQRAFFRDLFLTPGICRSTLILCFIWTVVLILYNFIIMNIEQFIPGDLLINIEVLSVLELLSCLVCIPIIVYTKRRISLVFCFIFTGITFLLTKFTTNQTLQQILTLAGQVSNCTSFNILLVFTSEIYPTVIRNMGLGTVNGVGRMVAAVTPVVVSMLRNGEEILLFGVISIIAGFLVWILPETKGLTLLDSLQDGEEFNKVCGGIPCGSTPEYQNLDSLIKSNK